MGEMSDHETPDPTPGSRPPESHRRWLDEASDVELCRALLEERQEFLPAALEGIRLEVERRDLDAERVLRSVPRRRRLGAERRRYLYGGLVIAGLGLIPALFPRSRTVEMLIHLDNPSADALRVNIGDDSTNVEPDSHVAVPVNVEVEEVPLVSLFRRVFGASGTKGASTGPPKRPAARLEVSVEVRTRGGALLDRRTFEASVGSRSVISLKPGTRYDLVTRRYRLKGRVARPEGADESVEVVSTRDPWDLSRFPVGDRTVEVDLFETPFPSALELPDDVPEGGVVTVTRLVRR